LADRLKFAIVKPIYKKGEKTDMPIYRPISLSTSFSKILEKVAYNRLSQHLYLNKIITPEQFGFQKNSTETAIYTLTNNILKTLDEPNHILGIFCDLSKAFDCVNHGILLDKLLYYGIHDMAMLWFKSCLENRRQRVEIWHNELGKTFCNCETKSGVPQGSVVGPLLFLLYINDLPLGINTDSKLLLYADTSVLVSGTNIQELQTKSVIALDNINNWRVRNCLSLNLKKTKIMQFNSNYLNNVPFQIPY
jgi:hypothetical protein